jgi:hypothetical protein
LTQIHRLRRFKDSSSSGCQTAPEKKSFEELIALYAVRDDSNWPVARAYLSETRKIDPATVDEMRAVGSIYANDYRPNPSLVCSFIAIRTAKCAAPPFATPGISPGSTRALGSFSPF